MHAREEDKLEAAIELSATHSFFQVTAAVIVKASSPLKRKLFTMEDSDSEPKDESENKALKRLRLEDGEQGVAFAKQQCFTFSSSSSFGFK